MATDLQEAYAAACERGHGPDAACREVARRFDLDAATVRRLLDSAGRNDRREIANGFRAARREGASHPEAVRASISTTKENR